MILISYTKNNLVLTYLKVFITRIVQIALSLASYHGNQHCKDFENHIIQEVPDLPKHVHNMMYEF